MKAASQNLDIILTVIGAPRSRIQNPHPALRSQHAQSNKLFFGALKTRARRLNFIKDLPEILVKDPEHGRSLSLKGGLLTVHDSLRTES